LDRRRALLRPHARRCPGRAPRRGSLYLEGFLVAFLAGTFLAILAPHFVRARASARRIQCLNNLKNVSLALANYAEQHETFPPGYIARDVTPDDGAAQERGPGWGWAAMALPQMECFPTYRTLDFQADLTGAAGVISLFVCPDDQPAPFSVTSNVYGLVTLPPSSFVGVAGRGSLTDRPGQPPGPGMFYRNSRVRLEDVTDGISNTFLLGERRAFFELSRDRIVETSSTWAGAVSGVFRDPGYPDEKRLEGPGTLVLGIVGQDRPIPLTIPPNRAPGGLGFSSSHAGAVHFARVDGSCGLVSEQIDAGVFARLGQRADRESVSWP